MQTLTRFLAALECVFRTKVDSDSGANWTVIPEQTGHRFRRQTGQFLA